MGRDAAACRQMCTNRLPDRGDIVGRIVPVVELVCFGAAARDYEHPCSNPALKRTVVPAPADAVIQTNAPCTLIEQRGVLLACTFGARPSQAAGTIALIGDSHASHLRAALDVVALARGWRGVSITRASCPFTRAATAGAATPTARARCARWKRDVSRWLSQAPVREDRLRVSGRLQLRDRTRGKRQLRREGDRLHRSLEIDAALGPPCHRRPRRAPERLEHDGLRPTGDRQVPTGGTGVRGPASCRTRLGPRARRCGQAALQTHTGDRPDPLHGPQECYPVIGGALVHSGLPPPHPGVRHDARTVPAATTRPGSWHRGEIGITASGWRRRSAPPVDAIEP